MLHWFLSDIPIFNIFFLNYFLVHFSQWKFSYYYSNLFCNEVNILIYILVQPAFVVGS